MAINTAEIFVITDMPPHHGCSWSVSWPEYGRVNRTHNQAKLIEAAFKSSNRFGISLDNGNVHWLNSIVYYQSRLSIEELVNHMSLSSAIVGFAFESRDNAEQFVDLAEKQIIMNLLKRDYSND